MDTQFLKYVMPGGEAQGVPQVIEAGALRGGAYWLGSWTRAPLLLVLQPLALAAPPGAKAR